MGVCFKQIALDNPGDPFGESAAIDAGFFIFLRQTIANGAAPAEPGP